MKKWLYLLFAILLEVSASLALKGALENTLLYTFVVIGYFGSFGALFFSLRNGMRLGVGYGIWGASGVSLTALMSTFLYGEPLTVTMGIGMLIVITGVLVVNLGSQQARKNSEGA